MPPKKKEELPAEPVDVDFLADDRQAMETEDTARVMVDYLLGFVATHADTSNLQKLVPMYAADRLLNDALAAVDLAFVRRDDHCSESPGSAGCADWLHEVDYEPTPAPVDRWARGAVPTIAKQTVAEVEEVRPASKRSGRSSRTSSAGGGKKSSPGDGGGVSRPGSAAVRATTPATDVTAGKPEGLLKSRNLTGEAADREQRMRDELNARKQIEEQQKTRARADKEELVKLEKFQKELRGKQYSYDAKGNLVMLAPVDPDKLPNNQLMPAHKLLLTQAERDAAEAEAEAKKGKKGTASRAEPADKKKSNHSANSDFIRLDQQEVPSLLETMSVEPGVTLREKGASKQGPKEEPDASRMTRADFMELVQSTSNLAQQSSFQDDAREQDSRRASREGGLGDAADWMGDATPVASPAPRVMVKPDVNVLLTKSPDWGLNKSVRDIPYSPSKPPYKPTEKMRQMTLGTLTQTPKDRPFTIATGLKKQATIINPMSPS